MAKEDGITLNSDLLGMIYQALELVKDIPGISDFIKKMNTFATEESKHMALNDLINIMQNTSAEVDLVAAARAMSGATKGINISQHQDIQNCIDGFLHRCLQQLFLKAWLQFHHPVLRFPAKTLRDCVKSSVKSRTVMEFLYTLDSLDYTLSTEY